jgi:hypothetical protein
MIRLVSRDAQLLLHTVPHTSQDSTVREVRTCLHVMDPAQHIQLEYANCEIADRLCPRRCHWNGCQAILNSIYALKQHVRQHQSEVEPIGPAMVSTLCGMNPKNSQLTCLSQTVSCQWKQCRMVCEQFSLLRHLYRHIERDIICVYDGTCGERHSSAIQC